jgi:hypothetical protein
LWSFNCWLSYHGYKFRRKKIKIDSKPIFFTVFILATAILFLRLYFVNDGLSDGNGKIPTLNEVSVLGYILFEHVP